MTVPRTIPEADPPTYRVNFPWTRPPLNANRKTSWQETWRVGKEIQNDAILMAQVAHLPKGLERIHLEFHFVPYTSGRNDAPNLHPTVKPLIDGFVKYGLIADDDSTRYSESCHIDPVVSNKVQEANRCYVIITDLTGIPKEAA